jgi:hypothetical protein
MSDLLIDAIELSLSERRKRNEESSRLAQACAESFSDISATGKRGTIQEGDRLWMVRREVQPSQLAVASASGVPPLL